MKKLLLLVFIITGLNSIAQKNELTLSDAILKAYSEYAPERMSQLEWLPNTNRYAFVDNTDSTSVLTIIDASSGNASNALSLSELNELISDDAPLTRFPNLIWLTDDRVTFTKSKIHYVCNLTSKKLTKLFSLPEGGEHLKFNPQHTAVAYVKQHNLYVLKYDGTNIQITSDGKPGIVYGQAVHRSEFGIRDGIFWADNGQKLAFYRMDETMVTNYPLVDIENEPAEVRNIKYPMAGDKSHHVTVGCYDLKQSKLSYVDTGLPKEQYLTNITWTPDASQLLIAIVNRDQNQMALNLYSASGSFVRTIFREEDEAYVEPEHGAWFVPSSKDQFLWMSERNGFQHLYKYDLLGNDLGHVTTGDYEVHEILGFDPTSNYLLVNGTGETKMDKRGLNDTYNGTQRYTYLIDYELGGYSLLDSTIGTHASMLSFDGKYIIESFSSVQTPRRYSLFESNGKQIRTIKNSANPLQNTKVGEVDLLTVYAEDNTPLYGRLIKPFDFDSTKKYPVVIYVYGGPHAQLVRNTFLGGASLWMYHLANKGYLVFTLDNRGSANRGIDFEQQTFRKLGQVEMVDQMAGVNFLKQLPYVDSEKIGVHGWSYGGFMTTNLLLTYPGTFKVGVAGGPVCDWHMYEVMYTERYMDTPEQNPDGYAKANLIERSGSLVDKLMMIHGTVDDVVVWQHSQKFVKRCIDQGIQMDYFIYPGHPHNVRGKDRVHLMQKVIDYVESGL